MDYIAKADEPKENSREKHRGRQLPLLRTVSSLGGNDNIHKENSAGEFHDQEKGSPGTLG